MKSARRHREARSSQLTGDAEFNEVYFDNVRVHESPDVLGRTQQRLGGRASPP